MERMTEKAWGNLDPWECCGQDHYCKRGCFDEGGCNNGCIVPKIYDKLAKYEDAEEQGRLIVLPCALGETVYRISHQQDSYDGIDRTVILQHPFSCEDLSQIGKRVFLSREEAEKASEEKEKT